jgi:hypothetical protein
VLYPNTEINNVMSGCIELGLELGNLEFGPPFLSFGYA